MNEIWRDIKGYEGIYQVSNLGNVKSLNYMNTGEEKVLKGGLLKSGYRIVSLSKNGKAKSINVHRLVAEAFIDNPDNLPEVNHKNLNKSDNNVDNLEWCDRKYNLSYGRSGWEWGKDEPVALFYKGQFVDTFRRPKYAGDYLVKSNIFPRYQYIYELLNKGHCYFGYTCFYVLNDIN